MDWKDPLPLILACIVVSIIGVIVGMTCEFTGPRDCLESVNKRPCIEGTVNYDGNGECECLTQYGELEWQLYPGCDMD